MARSFIGFCRSQGHGETKFWEAFDRVVAFANSWVTVAHLVQNGFNDLAVQDDVDRKEVTVATLATNRMATVMWALDREYAVGNGLALPDGTPLVDDEKSKDARLALRTSVLGGHVAVGFAASVLKGATKPARSSLELGARQTHLTSMWDAFNAAVKASENTAAASALLGEQWKKFTDDMDTGTRSVADSLNEYKTANALQSIVSSKPEVKDFVAAMRVAFGDVDDGKGGGAGGGGGGGGGGGRGGFRGQGETALIQAFSDLQQRNAQLSCAVAFLNRRVAVANLTIAGVSAAVVGNDARARKINRYIGEFSVSHADDALKGVDAGLAQELTHRSEMLNLVAVASMAIYPSQIINRITVAIEEYFTAAGVPDALNERATARIAWINGTGQHREHFVQYARKIIDAVRHEHAALGMQPVEEKKEDNGGDPQTSDAVLRRICAVQHARARARLLVFPVPMLDAQLYEAGRVFDWTTMDPLYHADSEFTIAMRAVCAVASVPVTDAVLARNGNIALAWCSQQLAQPVVPHTLTSAMLVALYANPNAQQAPGILDQPADRKAYIDIFANIMTTLNGLHAQLIDTYKELLQKELRETPTMQETLEIIAHAYGEARMIDRVFRHGEGGQAQLAKLWDDYFQSASIKTETMKRVFDIISNASTPNAEQVRIFADAELKWGIASAEKKTTAELKIENDTRVRDLEMERVSVATRMFKSIIDTCTTRAKLHRDAMAGVGARLLAARSRLEDIEPGPLEFPADAVERAAVVQANQLSKFPFPSQLAAAVRDVAVNVGLGANRFFGSAAVRQVQAVVDFEQSVGNLATGMRFTRIQGVVTSGAHLLSRLWASATGAETQLDNMRSMLAIVSSTLQSFSEGDLPTKYSHLERNFTAAMEQRNLGDLLDKIQEDLTERARRDREATGKDMKWEEMLGLTLLNAADAHNALAVTVQHATAMRQAMVYPSEIQGYTDASVQLKALVASRDDARIKTDEVTRVSGSMRMYLSWSFKAMLEYLSLTVADRRLDMPGQPAVAAHSLVKRLGDLNRRFQEKIENDMLEVRDRARAIADAADGAKRTIEGSLPTAVALAEQILQLKRHRASALAYAQFQNQLVDAFVPPAPVAAGHAAHGALVEMLYLDDLAQLNIGWRPRPDDEFTTVHGRQVGTVLLHIFRCIDRAAQVYMECIGRLVAAMPQSAPRDALQQQLAAFVQAVMDPNGFVTQSPHDHTRWFSLINGLPACSFEAALRILNDDRTFCAEPDFVSTYTNYIAHPDTVINNNWAHGIVIGTDAAQRTQAIDDVRFATMDALRQQVANARASLLEVIPNALRTASGFVDLVNRTRYMEYGLFRAAAPGAGRLYREAWGVSRERSVNETAATRNHFAEYDAKREAVLRGLASLSFVQVPGNVTLSMPYQNANNQYQATPNELAVFFPAQAPAGQADWAFPWHISGNASLNAKRAAWRDAKQTILRGWDLVSRLRSVTSTVFDLQGAVPPGHPGAHDALAQITRSANNAPAASYDEIVRPAQMNRITWGMQVLPDTTLALGRTIAHLGAFDVGLMQEDQKVSDRTTPLKEIQRRQGVARAAILNDYRALEGGGRAYWVNVLKHMRLDGTQFGTPDAALLGRDDWAHVQRLALELKTTAAEEHKKTERAIANLTERFTQVDTRTQILLNDLRNAIGRWVFAQTHGVAMAMRNSLNNMRPPQRISNRWSLYGAEDRGNALPDVGFERNVLVFTSAADADAADLLGDLENAIQLAGVEGFKAIVKGRETELYREAKAVIDSHAASIGPGSVFADVASARTELNDIRALLQSQGMELSDPSIRGTMKDALALLQRLILIKNAARDASAGYSVSGGAVVPAGGAAGRADGKGDDDDDTGIRDLAGPQRALQGQGEYSRLEVIASGDAQRDWIICRLARWLTIVQGDARIDRVAKMIQGGGLHVSNGFVYFNSSTEYAGLVRQSRGLRERLNLAMANASRMAANGFEAVPGQVQANMQANQQQLMAAKQAVAGLVNDILVVNNAVALAHANMDKMLDDLMDQIRGRIRGWKYANADRTHAVYRVPGNDNEQNSDDRAHIEAAHGRRVPNGHDAAPPPHDPVLYDPLEGPDYEMRHFDLILYYLLSPEVYSALTGLLRLLSTCPGALKTAYDKLTSDQVRRRGAGGDRRTLTEWMVGAGGLDTPPVARRDTSLSRFFAAILFDDQLALLSAYLMSATLQGMVLTSTGMGGDAKADAVARAKITQRYRLLQHNIETYMRTHSLISRT